MSTDAGTGKGPAGYRRSAVRGLGVTRTMTIELPPGSTPAPRSSRTRRPGTGNVGRRCRPAASRNIRAARVSGRSRITPSTLESRALSWIRRSSAWASRGEVSASTPYRQVGMEIMASQPRWSRRVGRGTSVAHRTDRWSLARKASSSRMCAASRIGPLPGNARPENSSPTTSRSCATVAMDTFGLRPRSVRLIEAADRPTAEPTSARESPRSTRAS